MNTSFPQKKRRPSPYDSRLTTSHINIWEFLRLIRAVPIIDVCSFSQW